MLPVKVKLPGETAETCQHRLSLIQRLLTRFSGPGISQECRRVHAGMKKDAVAAIFRGEVAVSTEEYGSDHWLFEGRDASCLVEFVPGAGEVRDVSIRHRNPYEW